ncbi:DegT/DnrJ/EryC1/StrS aminotransferase family protein [Clostridium tertium]|uniref:DegT/DnrJ/EryC1/StrS family aminotransferase n=1 Tax=Clostridium tertium TaxID=1559 RepID=UPI00155A5737|nr:DegT/DnrJ/EryC1/StrS aminotransferase family protein [Clostridium tertium]MDB1941155.1 DegT/DnrJ/EryC1/StrS aminotransferase family protein [Clostridium tertium]MDB1953782.1 DegT/DnrJ/EryC1/StrS aminotransferase family protein [Clostridium tertium]MDB1958392.1 DegT/DnrJ/EryC1/StrS aminotransferase family protein [Clostridium tertium]MDB1961738.1 DegT/DnrJ/EryC1/StrS aminotransferase family protein [Clostridium tertium]MDB1964408.1 DegT/DnrJ/EryC1/StrS aminotransferase family protein [Clostr
MKKIPFSPPDITEAEINAVVEVLRSGWITSGPTLAKFEEELAQYCEANKAVALNSATAAMELILKVFDIKEGDEIITTPYTYTATASVAVHRGIKPIFCDVAKDSFFIDYDKIGDLITEKTKVIMPVDFAGVPCDYDRIKEVLKEKNREDIIIIVDSAHAFGAKYKGQRVGAQCDFHTFSFHAVKNFTTAEGGAITYNDNNFKGRENLFQDFKFTSLHGQSKDALSKMKAGAWEYDIITDGFKCNMTDINAAIGRAQLTRYEDMLKYRKEIFNTYTRILEKEDFAIIPVTEYGEGTESSYHIYPLRIKGFNEEKRNILIQRLAEKGISTNVHFKPLPMFTLYKNLGYKIEDYPNAYAQYANEISLPVYSTLELSDVEYIAIELIEEVKKLLMK